MTSALPSIRDFAAEGGQPDRYLRLDDDWSIALADVIDSTGLAASGHDRDVNFVAAGVVAVLSRVAARTGEVAACQFGGDGAIAAVPAERRTETEKALAALAHWSNIEIGVPLRVGLVPMRALHDAGLEVRAALQDFGNGNAFGLFLGAGVAAADRWVKTDPRWSIAAQPGDLPGLEGVSCRWTPLPSQRGVVLCVIADAVEPGPQGQAHLSALQTALEQIVPTEVAAPMGKGERLVPNLLPSRNSLRLESRTEPPARRLWRMVKAVIGTLILGGVHRLGGHLGNLDVVRYRRATAERSDYRKLAGGPRLVLDVTQDEADRIEQLLAAAEMRGEIHYGTSRSDATAMTCLVGNFAADQHIHFVDGAGLGFWRAATVLKAKLKP